MAGNFAPGQLDQPFGIIGLYQNWNGFMTGNAMPRLITYSADQHASAGGDRRADDFEPVRMPWAQVDHHEIGRFHAKDFGDCSAVEGPAANDNPKRPLQRRGGIERNDAVVLHDKDNAIGLFHSVKPFCDCHDKHRYGSGVI